jgi:hypothetical protein
MFLEEPSSVTLNGFKLKQHGQKKPKKKDITYKSKIAKALKKKHSNHECQRY